MAHTHVLSAACVVQNKALSKEKELLRSHVVTLKEQLEAARGTAATIAALPPDVRTSAPTLAAAPSDSRASSPCGSILAAVSSGVNPALRPLPLDMSLFGSGGAAAPPCAGDAALASGSSSATPQDLSPWPGGSSQSGEVGGARLMIPAHPATALAIPTAAPAAAIRSPFAGTQVMLAAADAAAAAPAPAGVTAGVAPFAAPPYELSSLAQVTTSPAMPPVATAAPGAVEAAGNRMVAGPVTGATIAAALDTGSPAATRPLSPVAEGAAEGSTSSAIGQGDSTQGLPKPVSTDSGDVAAAASPSAAARHPPPAPAS